MIEKNSGSSYENENSKWRAIMSKKSKNSQYSKHSKNNKASKLPDKGSPYSPKSSSTPYYSTTLI